MPTHRRRPAECDAMKVTDDNAADVASWCDGVAMPDGIVMFPVGARAWSPASSGQYIVREGNRLRLESAADFEHQWTPAGDE